MTQAQREAILKRDKGRKAGLDAIIVTALLLLLTVVVANVGLLGFSIGVQTAILALATAMLAGASFLFNTIDWRNLDPLGPGIMNRAKADIYLTTISIGALFTVVLMAIIEFLALLVFVEVIPPRSIGAAGAALARSFMLIQTIMLLVYLLALVIRENNASRYQPSGKALVAAKVLTPMAFAAVAVGVLLAFEVVPLAGIRVHQAVYVVTLGVLLEFMAMRIRLRLPSLWSLFRTAVAQGKRPTPEMKDMLRRRAVRTYVAASVFVAASMGLAGLVMTGSVALDNGGVVGSLVIFYVGTALIMGGLIVVRILQTRSDRPVPEGEGELGRLVGQKRRSAQEVFRIAVYAVTGFLSLVAAVLCVLTAMGKMGWHPKFATDLFILASMFGAGPVGFFYNRERNRIAAIDEKFPDFLRDLAESARAGMTLPRALVSAAQGSYGALTPEIKVMAAQVQWGVEFGEALARFAGRCRTPLIDRTVSLVVEAQRAGGSVVDILTAASEDAREIKQIVAERSSQMAMYNVVIYISFMVFIVVVMVLAAQFIPAFKSAVGAATGQSVGGLSFRDFDVEDFNTIFFQAAVVQAIGGGLVGGVLSKGHPLAGFMHIAIMMVLAWISFRLVILLLVPGAPA